MTHREPSMYQMLLDDLAQMKTLTQALAAYQQVGMAAKDFFQRTRTGYTWLDNQLFQLQASPGG